MTEAPADAAFQGARGAFSEEASRALLGADARLLPCTAFDGVFEAVRSGRARFGVVPIENTLAGSIHACYDLLAAGDLIIVGEIVLRISHSLIAAPGMRLDKVRRVLSHPVALAQCEGFFRAHPAIEAVPVYDTAGAVEQVIRDGMPDAAAIAGAHAARVYGGVVLADALEDHQQNFTRFLQLAPAAAVRTPSPRGPGTAYKTSLLLRLSNRPGALYRCLQAFAEREVDLAKIESRPLRGAPFEYLFYLDLIGATDDPKVAEAIEALGPHTLSVRVLGSYPR